MAVEHRRHDLQSNRSAIGARIKVVVNTDTGPREIHRVVGFGGSFGSSPLRQEIGLGTAATIDRVEIRWPASGLVQTIRGLDPNRFYEVTEGRSAAAGYTPRRFAWR